MTDKTKHPDDVAHEIKFMTSAEFAEAKHQHEWLVESVLVKGQPGVIGGEVKTLKTSLGIDLAVSLDSGQPFLGKFKVPRQCKVAFLSGESGAATIRDTAVRVCGAKGIRLRDCDVLWSTKLPNLGLASGRNALRHFLRSEGVEVVILDPLYLLLGGVGAAASNLYEIGPMLHAVGRACLEPGATPILIHHTVKGASSRAKQPRPLVLDALTFGGIGEFVRQWLLLSRRGPYVDGTGDHNLIMAVGGSAGHSALWDVDVHEGALGDDFGGREWRVQVRPGGGNASKKSC